MTACTVCRLPSDVRAELERDVALGVPLRSIEARVAEAGHKARKDAIARHMRNNHRSDDERVELRAIGVALRRVMPTVPNVALALADEVDREGAWDLAAALREVAAKNGARAGGLCQLSGPGAHQRTETK